MNKLQNILVLFILMQLAEAFYMQQKRAAANTQNFMNNAAMKKDDWTMFKHKPQTHGKVKIADKYKKETALHRIVNLINKQKKITANKRNKMEKPQDVQNLFNILLALAKQNLQENELKVLKRPRRRVSVQMVSDMSTDRIDELLQMFREENEINTVKPSAKDDDAEYNFDLTQAEDDDDNDYVYEHLYDDEQDMTLPRSAQHNTEFGSIQDLILQATQNEWQREKEETKLHNRRTQHFI